jgi:cytochrome c
MVLAVCKVFAAGDVEKGRKIAKKCTICHTLNEGGKNRLGPNLFDILGKPAGAVEGYKYSKALLASGIVWDDDTFSDFVLNPKKVIKRTKMSFKGIKKVTHRVDLLAYFKTLRSDTGDQQSVGNVEEGKRVAAKHCVICHSFEKGGKVVYGPNLFGIVGAPGGAIAGYEYSAALKNAGLTWTDANLIGFVANPEKFLKGTKARFPGLKSAKQRADLLAYLKTLK